MSKLNGLTIGTVVSVLLAGGSQVHAGAPPDHSRQSRAGLYERTMGSGDDYQIHQRFCRKPKAERGCRRISEAMRSEIEQALGGSISWVWRPDPGGPRYWVLTAVRFDDDRAAYGFVRREASDPTCYAQGNLLFRWIGERWRQTAGGGQVGCSSHDGG